MAYVPTNAPDEDDESANLGTSLNPNTAEPTESAAPGAAGSSVGITDTGGGGVTPSNNSTTSVSQSTNGVEPTGQSQLAQQSGLALSAQPYINSQANQNAIAGQSTGIATNLNNETSQSNQATTAGTTSLTNAVSAGSTPLDTSTNSSIVNNPTGITAAQQAELTKELSGSYTGPTSDTSYYTGANQPAATAAGNAETLEQGNIAGPETYFAQNGVQGQGNQALDAALFAGSSKAQAAVQPAVLKAQAAPANVSGAIEQGQNSIIPQGQTNATNTQQATEAALNAGITNYTAQGNAAAAANVTKYNQLAQTTTAFLQTPTTITGTPTATQAQALSALGYTPAQWNSLVASYNDLAKLQYVQNLVKTSGMPITQNASGQFINQLTGDAIVFPNTIPPPAGVDLSKGLTVQEASQLFNMGNSANPKIQQDINALEGFLGQSSTQTNPSTTTGQQFTYAPPNLATNVTSQQQSLTNQNNLAQAAINTALANPSAALKSGSTLGIAYALGGATLAVQVGKSLYQEGSNIYSSLGNAVSANASAAGAAPATANATGAGVAAAAQALSVVGAAYGIYSFIENYKPGDSVADAMSGATTGASVGAAVGTVIFPGIGTAAGTLIGAVVGAVVGAISGLFGSKPDPEDAYFEQYQAQAASMEGFQMGQNVPMTAPLSQSYIPSQNLIDLAESNSAPATTLEGLMDLQGVQGIPIYNQFGRMGGGTFIDEMTQQIDQAATKGSINYYSTPQQIYTQVIAPWISKMGAWTNPNSPSIIALIIAMIGQYTSGNTSKWTWINGTNYINQQTKPFSQFVSDAYAPSNWINPPTEPGNTQSNPIAANNGPVPTSG